MFQSCIGRESKHKKLPPQLKPNLTLKGFGRLAMSHISPNPMGCLTYFASLIVHSYNSNI